MPVPQQKCLELTILGKMRQPKHFGAKISPTYIPLHLSAEQGFFFPSHAGGPKLRNLFLDLTRFAIAHIHNPVLANSSFIKLDDVYSKTNKNTIDK